MDLPDDVALLWGLRDAPRRGPKAQLTVSDIVRAAVAVADADGLDAVSMARVASELGNATMAIYRHVRSKDELLTLMVDAAVETPPPLPEGDWRAAILAWSKAIIAVARRHPWYAQIPTRRPPIGPNNLAWFDSALGALEPTRLDPGERVRVVMGLITYVQGHVRLGFELSAGHAADPGAFGSRFGALLATVVDPRQMPALGAVVATGVFDEDLTTGFEEDIDADFTYGLNIYLDGIAARIEVPQRTSEP